MAKIPYQGLPEVAPSGQGAPMPHQEPVTGYDALSQGAQQFGHAVGSQLERAAKEYDQRVEESHKKALEAEVTEGETEWNTHRTAKKYGRRSGGSASQDAGDAAFGGEPVEQQGYFNMQGDDAFKAAPDTFNSIEKKRTEIADNMGDKDARELFLKRTAPTLDSDRAHIEEFAGKQREVADLATLKAREESGLEAVRANPGDFVEVTRQTAALEEPIRKLGLSDTDKQARIEEWRRKVGVAQVLAQLKDNPNGWQEAEKTLESKRATIGEEASAKLDGAVKIAKNKALGTEVALQLIGAARKPNGFLDEAKAVASFEALPEAERSQEAKIALDHLLTLEKERETSVRSDNFDTALSAYLQRNNLNDVPPNLKFWMIGDGKTPGNDPKAWQALLQVQKADREHARGAPATDVQRRALVQFETDLHDNPDKYAAMSEAQFNATVWPQLAKNDRERAGALFAAAHGKPEKPGTLNPLENDMLLQKGRDAGLFPPKGKDPAQWDAEAADLFYKATETLQAQAKQYRATSKNHEAPPFELVKQWADSLVLKGKIPDKFFGASTTRLEALQRGTKFEPEWKPEDVSKAVKALQKAGVPVNNETIDTALRRVFGMPAAPVREPEQQPKPPSTVSDAIERPDWGLDLATPDIPYGD